MIENSTWYTLDNQANIYPAISDLKNTNVFRLSCRLTYPVRPDLLQKALENTMPDFPYYSMIMRRGLFWFYFEPSDIIPQVIYEHQRPCKQLFHIQNKDLLFEVSYFGNRVNLEVFHALADGGGAMQLLRMLIYKYILLAHPEDFPAPPLLDKVVSPVQQAEDGFRKHYTHGEKTSPFKEKAFVIEGTTLPLNDVQIISAEMPTGQILKLVKKAGVTLTTYITALMICAIYNEVMPKRQEEKDISITIPVDLRGMFPSQTFRNFFSVVDVRYNFAENSSAFEYVLQSVHQQLLEKVNPDALMRTLNYNMGAQENIFARAVPLFIKNRVLKGIYKNGEKSNTTTISNLGRITMPVEMLSYIENFSCLINPTTIHRVKLCISSFEDTMKMNFTSRIEETGIQRYFIRHLTNNGIDVTITTNGGSPIETL